MKKNTCRGCDEGGLELLYDFGLQPLAGNYPSNAPDSLKVKRYSLDLTLCPSCGLLQVTTLPPIDEVFNDDYRYSTSTIPSLVLHFEQYAKWISDLLPVGSSVLEFGCNDGTLLKILSDMGYVCKGVDASGNVAAIARERGVNIDVGFFDMDYVQAMHLCSTFDYISCSNVFAHIDKLHEATSAAWSALKLGGLFCVEVHDGSKIYSENQFDTIYHEHLSYFTARSLRHHLELHGFSLVSDECTPMHGGGIRVLVKKVDKSRSKVFLAQKNPLIDVDGLYRPDIKDAISLARDSVLRIGESHLNIWGYGAAGRSQMFVNFTGTSSLIREVFDDSSLRQERYIVGTDIPIKSFREIDHDGACIILAWNYADYIAPKILPYFESVYTVLPELKKW